MALKYKKNYNKIVKKIITCNIYVKIKYTALHFQILMKLCARAVNEMSESRFEFARLSSLWPNKK